MFSHLYYVCNTCAVQLPPEEIKAIDARARERNVTRSELIREAVLA
ncbi:CopG family transcriptional regulator [Actinotignum sanguinis]|nr:CopG family transcriptional regulator [Actinotignum sanguinis]MDY5148840.1 CopG family transcriptional regulator [Actinotignum sanguinis]